MTETPTKTRPASTAAAPTWATLSLGLLLLIVTTSGAALVLRPEMDRLLHQSLYTASPGVAAVSLEEAIEAVHQNYPKSPVLFVTPPEPADRYLVAVDEPYRFVFVDPVTGTVAGDFAAETGVLGFLTRLHTAFFADEILLPNVGWPLSQVILGSSAIVLLLMVVTGAVLWWPGIRRFLVNGFAVRLGRNSYTTNHDLHKVVGVVALLPLLLWALTAANFEFYDLVHALFYALTPGEAPPELAEVVSNPNSGTGITADTARQIALDAVPGARFSSIVPPADETGYYDVWLARGLDPYEHGDFPGETLVQVDRYGGAILQQAYVDYDNTATEAYEMWSYPIHTGILAPWPVRLLWDSLWADAPGSGRHRSGDVVAQAASAPPGRAPARCRGAFARPGRLSTRESPVLGESGRTLPLSRVCRGPGCQDAGSIG